MLPAIIQPETVMRSQVSFPFTFLLSKLKTALQFFFAAEKEAQPENDGFCIEAKRIVASNAIQHNKKYEK